MITPIEMLSMVPKSQEASIVHHSEHVRQNAQQQGGMQKVEQQARQNVQQTVKATHAENPEYRYDAKEQGNNSYSSDRQKKKKQEPKQNEQSESNTPSQGGFDVRI